MPTPSLLNPCGPGLPCHASTACGDPLFDSVRVIPKVTGGTTIVWDFRPTPTVRPPYSFQVQVGRADAVEDEWQTLGAFVRNAYFHVDAAHRDAGFYRRTYYRVAVRAGNNAVYYSQPVAADSQILSPGQSRLYRELIRRETSRYRDPEAPATIGYLLKVRYHGDPCPECTDPDSGLCYKSDCGTCFGVGYDKGYYPPFPCFYADLGPMKHDLKMFTDQGPVIAGGVCSLRYLNIPPVHPWDVWVDAASDHRLVIGEITPITSFGVYDLICVAAAARLSFDHPVYKIPVG